MTDTVQSVLADIQSKINVPKNQHNKFGGYYYRSLEDIFMALKPLLAAHGAAVTTQDELILVGERYYVKATATLTWGSESISCTGYAREAEDRKGMDASQVTGSTSSYARKYAMNGLFAIDDSKDADATNTHGKESKSKPKQDPKPEPKPETPMVSNDQLKALNTVMGELGITDRDQKIHTVNNWLKSSGHAEISSSKELTKTQASKLIELLKAELNDGTEGDNEADK